MSAKQKNIILLIGFIMLLWIAHQLSFSKTIVLKKQLFNLKEEVLLFENSSQKFRLLQEEDRYYDSILKAKHISSYKSFQNNLLTTINSFADSTNIKVISFQNPHVFQPEDAEIRTFSFTVHGSFNHITQLIHQLEQYYKFGKIISVKFLKKRYYRRGAQYLQCTILIQKITNYL